ncbi:hypothetical protein AFM11_11530 [Mycolicibacterium wolinskyi]|uniref:SsuA/THI5-like domain-containing protein n=1 Tax=Mycolicibacterium wolinskyi TaxID=59750 RepID=A0A132PNW6_9MYCO|nr:hypothetical protein [Mycolicibacterium wolinskyi]KWX23993.1 hypothetical protein AFM11_11530 [Mycolicibacterium wolinskyi]
MKIVLGKDDLAATAVAAAGADAERLGIRPVHKASRGFVSGTSADICELAIVTLLQAVAYDKPVALLPITMLGRHQHQTLVTMGDLGIADLPGRRVGVRSWSQTTGVWLRGFLSEQYGVDLKTIEWQTYEGAHVDEAADPSWVARADDGAKLQVDFLEGRLDYGIMGNERPDDDRIRTAIPDAAEVAAKWAADHGFAPVNHVVGVNVAAAKADPAAVLAVYDALARAVSGLPANGSVNLNPVGFNGLRGPITAAARYAYEQQVLPRPVEFDEIVDRTCAALGVPASRLGG